MLVTLRDGSRVTARQAAQSARARGRPDRAEARDMRGGLSGEPYEGPYDVTPRLDPQVLATRGRTMRDDVTVDGIPNYRTTNLSGGYTVVIAQD